MDRVAGKVALITGIARGQGRSHAIRLAEEGADIIGVDICGPIEHNQVPPAVEALDRRIITVKGDVRDQDVLDDLVSRGLTEFGKIDIVCANAGVINYGLTESFSDDQWQMIIDINLTAVWRTCRAVIPHLEPGASIIITSSTGGLKGNAHIAPYTCAKHGVVGLMKTLAIELGPKGIRVNTVAPSAVNTDMMINDFTMGTFLGDDPDPTHEKFEAVAKQMHVFDVGWVEPVDISNAVLFLASDEARYITGVSLPVDAGCLVK
jgi:SDR family mycofactocin-dependent oxidoreductase